MVKRGMRIASKRKVVLEKRGASDVTDPRSITLHFGFLITTCLPEYSKHNIETTPTSSRFWSSRTRTPEAEKARMDAEALCRTDRFKCLTRSYVDSVIIRRIFHDNRAALAVEVPIFLALL